MIPKHPNTDTFHTGDLVWPKKPGAYIPYQYDVNLEPLSDKADWEDRKQKALQRLKNEPSAEPLVSNLSTLRFDEFRERYLRGRSAEAMSPYAGGGIAAVGHIGILAEDATGTWWIYEALPKTGITKSKYVEWIAGRADEIVWHGRLKDLTTGEPIGAENGASVAAEAAKWVGVPYDFWNFDLDDPSGFYCSKYVWLCVFRSLKVPIDGDKNPKRSFWLSPKQVLYSASVIRLHDPGEYAIE